MFQTYEEAGTGLLEQLPRVGDVVAALYEGDWYRAFVKALNVNAGTCQVLYVDYLNERDVALGDLRLLNDEFCSLPVQVSAVTLPSYEFFRMLEALF